MKIAIFIFDGLTADRAIAEVSDPDIVLVPGGRGTRPLLEDEEVLSWLRQVDEGTTWTTSVCTGSLVLGAAGIDMALHLVGREVGPELAQTIQLRIEYDPQPPSTPAPPEKLRRRSSKP